MTTITNMPKHLWVLFLSAWHTMWGHPLHIAREAHHRAVRAMYRAEAELAYQHDMTEWFELQAQSMDPHSDWHLFAQLKDGWQEHSDQTKLELAQMQRTTAKVNSSAERLRKVEELG